MSSSATTVIPQRFCGLRVLLIESDKRLLQRHADILKQNSYRVTATTKASNGLVMMMNGHTYDGVLIDADMYETDMEGFLHQVLRHQPQMSIILMALDDIHLKIPKEARESEAVFCLQKPCGLRDISEIWKHICKNRISFEENVSNENLHKENQVHNNIHRIDPRAKPSPIDHDNTTNNNNIISSRNFTNHQAQVISSQVNDVMYKQVTYEDLFSDDDDQEDVDMIVTKGTMGASTTEKPDKGKKPINQKRKYEQPVGGYKCHKRRKEIKTRVTWKGELDNKFMIALKELGEQAQSSAILKHMNVPGLTRFHVASHLQKYHRKRKSIEASLAALVQRGKYLQLESIANKRYRHSTQSNDDASMVQSSSTLRSSNLNLGGILYMVIENIRAKLQEAPPLPPPQISTTHINNYGDNQDTEYSFGVVNYSNNGGQETEMQLIAHDYENAMETHVFGDAMAPSDVGATMASDYNLGMDNDCLLSGLDNENLGDASGSGPSQVQVQPASFGPATEPWVAGCGGVAASTDQSQEDLALPDFLSCDTEDLFPFQDFQVNNENLHHPVFPNSTTLFDVPNSLPFAPTSPDFSIPDIPAEENDSLAQVQLPGNSIDPLDDSEGRFMDNDLSQSDLGYTMGLLNDDDNGDDDDGNLIYGHWYFQSPWT